MDKRRSNPHGRTVFLIDVDNTLLDNDRVIADLNTHLQKAIGPRASRRYWNIFEDLRARLGYADYLGAMQQFRREHPRELRILTVSRFLIEYPFADRLFTGALNVIKRLQRWGKVALLSDGDVVFQPRKIQRSGLRDAVKGHVMIYVHKEQELPDVVRRYPADHYVLIDDKLRILTAVKRLWKSRVTTVFVRQGHYAFDRKVLAKYPPADVTVERIGDLLKLDRGDFS